MAKRLNTVEYAFPQIITTTAAGVVQNFSQITVDIPETTNRTFVSAFADVFTLDAVTTAASPTSWSLGVRVGGSGAFLNQTVTDTITNSGENMSFHFIFDVSSQFKTNFTSTSHVVDASFALAVSATNNTTCKLVLTYEWDDTDQTRVKTVRIPIESSTNALNTTLANISGGNYFQIPALDTFLPEASKVYKDIFFETYVNECTTAAQATNPTLGFALDAEASSEDGGHEDALISARLYRRIWKRTDMTTNVQHEFKAKTLGTAASMPFRMLGTILNVTYTYDEASTTQVMNSIILAGADEFGRPGGTTSADKSRFKRSLSIQEENPVLKQSGILFSFIDSGAVTLNVAVGSQVFTPYTSVATQVAGGFMFIHNFDASSRKGTGMTLSKNVEFVVDWYSTSATAGATGTNISALMYLNYLSDKSTLPGGSANHNHTVVPFFKAHAADALITTVTRQVIDIPETNRWITSIVPVISTYKASTTQTPDYIYLAAELDPSTSTGAGWTDLYNGAVTSDAEMAVQVMFARARREFRRWPYDTDNDRMYLEKSRSFRFARATNSYFGSYWPITYHTITNYISGQVSGYTGDGAGISIQAYDNVFLKEVIYEGSTNIGGGWGFPWYNSSTNIRVSAYQDSTHQGMNFGRPDVSLNISFGGAAPGGTATSWVF